MDAKEAAGARMRDVGATIREQRRNAEMSLRHLAERAGVSNPYLSQIERGLRNPSADILQRVAAALRISAETLYVQAGLLQEGSDDLAARIATAPELTERQRQVLLEVYHSLRDQGREAPTEDQGREAPTADQGREAPTA